MNKLEYESIGAKIVHAAYEVHNELGPGLLESVYEYCLVKELRTKNLKVESQVKLPIMYKGEMLDKEFVMDILVEEKIVIELKAVMEILPVHEVQLVTYLRLADMRLGYLINFNVPLIKNGIKRKVNSYYN